MKTLSTINLPERQIYSYNGFNRASMVSNSNQNMDYTTSPLKINRLENYKERLMNETLKKTKYKSVFKLGEHENKMITVDSDSDCEGKNTKTVRLVTANQKRQIGVSYKQPPQKNRTTLGTYIFKEKEEPKEEVDLTPREYNIRNPRYDYSYSYKVQNTAPDYQPKEKPLFRISSPNYNRITKLSKAFQSPYSGRKTGLSGYTSQERLSQQDLSKDDYLFEQYPRFSSTDSLTKEYYHSGFAYSKDLGGRVSLALNTEATTEGYVNTGSTFSPNKPTYDYDKILTIQRVYKKRLGRMERSASKIQSAFRMHSIRRHCVESIVKQYHQQAAVLRFEKFADLFAKRQLRQFVFKTSFKFDKLRAQKYAYKKAFENVKKNRFDFVRSKFLDIKKSDLSIEKNNSVTFLGENKEKKYEKLYKDIVKEVEDMKKFYQSLDKNLDPKKFNQKSFNQKSNKEFEDLKKKLGRINDHLDNVLNPKEKKISLKEVKVPLNENKRKLKVKSKGEKSDKISHSSSQGNLIENLQGKPNAFKGNDLKETTLGSFNILPPKKRKEKNEIKILEGIERRKKFQKKLLSKSNLLSSSFLNLSKTNICKFSLYNDFKKGAINKNNEDPKDSTAEKETEDKSLTVIFKRDDNKKGNPKSKGGKSRIDSQRTALTSERNQSINNSKISSSLNEIEHLKDISIIGEEIDRQSGTQTFEKNKIENLKELSVNRPKKKIITTAPKKQKLKIEYLEDLSNNRCSNKPKQKNATGPLRGVKKPADTDKAPQQKFNFEKRIAFQDRKAIIKPDIPTTAFKYKSLNEISQNRPRVEKEEEKEFVRTKNTYVYLENISKQREPEYKFNITIEPNRMDSLTLISQNRPKIQTTKTLRASVNRFKDNDEELFPPENKNENISIIHSKTDKPKQKFTYQYIEGLSRARKNNSKDKKIFKTKNTIETLSVNHSKTEKPIQKFKYQYIESLSKNLKKTPKDKETPKTKNKIETFSVNHSKTEKPIQKFKYQYIESLSKNLKKTPKDKETPKTKNKIETFSVNHSKTEKPTQEFKYQYIESLSKNLKKTPKDKETPKTKNKIETFSVNHSKTEKPTQEFKYQYIESLSKNLKKTPKDKETPKTKNKEASEAENKETSKAENKIETFSVNHSKTEKPIQEFTYQYNESLSKTLKKTPKNKEIPKIENKETSKPESKEIPKTENTIETFSVNHSKTEKPIQELKYQYIESLSKDRKKIPKDKETLKSENKEISKPEDKETLNPENKEISKPENKEILKTKNKEPSEPESKEIPKTKNTIETFSVNHSKTEKPIQELKYQYIESLSKDRKKTPKDKETLKSENKEISKPEDKETLNPENKETSEPKNKEISEPENKEISKPEDKEASESKEKEISKPENKETPKTENKIETFSVNHSKTEKPIQELKYQYIESLSKDRKKTSKDKETPKTENKIATFSVNHSKAEKPNQEFTYQYIESLSKTLKKSPKDKEVQESQEPKVEQPKPGQSKSKKGKKKNRGIVPQSQLTELVTMQKNLPVIVKGDSLNIESNPKRFTALAQTSIPIEPLNQTIKETIAIPKSEPEKEPSTELKTEAPKRSRNFKSKNKKKLVPQSLLQNMSTSKEGKGSFDKSTFEFTLPSTNTLLGNPEGESKKTVPPVQSNSSTFPEVKTTLSHCMEFKIDSNPKKQAFNELSINTDDQNNVEYTPSKPSEPETKDTKLVKQVPPISRAFNNFLFEKEFEDKYKVLSGNNSITTYSFQLLHSSRSTSDEDPEEKKEKNELDETIFLHNINRKNQKANYDVTKKNIMRTILPIKLHKNVQKSAKDYVYRTLINYFKENSKKSIIGDVLEKRRKKDMQKGFRKLREKVLYEKIKDALLNNKKEILCKSERKSSVGNELFPSEAVNELKMSRDGRDKNKKIIKTINLKDQKVPRSKSKRKPVDLGVKKAFYKWKGKKTIILPVRRLSRQLIEKNRGPIRDSMISEQSFISGSQQNSNRKDFRESNPYSSFENFSPVKLVEVKNEISSSNFQIIREPKVQECEIDHSNFQFVAEGPLKIMSEMILPSINRKPRKNKFKSKRLQPNQEITSLTFGQISKEYLIKKKKLEILNTVKVFSNDKLELIHKKPEKAEGFAQVKVPNEFDKILLKETKVFKWDYENTKLKPELSLNNEEFSIQSIEKEKKFKDNILSSSANNFSIQSKEKQNEYKETQTDLEEPKPELSLNSQEIFIQSIEKEKKFKDNILSSSAHNFNIQSEEKQNEYKETQTDLEEPKPELSLNKEEFSIQSIEKEKKFKDSILSSSVNNFSIQNKEKQNEFKETQTDIEEPKPELSLNSQEIFIQSNEKEKKFKDNILSSSAHNFNIQSKEKQNEFKETQTDIEDPNLNLEVSLNNEEFSIKPIEKEKRFKDNILSSSAHNFNIQSEEKQNEPKETQTDLEEPKPELSLNNEEFSIQSIEKEKKFKDSILSSSVNNFSIQRKEKQNEFKETQTDIEEPKPELSLNSEEIFIQSIEKEKKFKDNILSSSIHNFSIQSKEKQNEFKETQTDIEDPNLNLEVSPNNEEFSIQPIEKEKKFKDNILSSSAHNFNIQRKEKQNEFKETQTDLEEPKPELSLNSQEIFIKSIEKEKKFKDNILSSSANNFSIQNKEKQNEYKETQTDLEEPKPELSLNKEEFSIKPIEKEKRFKDNILSSSAHNFNIQSKEKQNEPKETQTDLEEPKPELSLNKEEFSIKPIEKEKKFKDNILSSSAHNFSIQNKEKQNEFKETQTDLEDLIQSKEENTVEFVALDILPEQKQKSISQQDNSESKEKVDKKQEEKIQPEEKVEEQQPEIKVDEQLEIKPEEKVEEQPEEKIEEKQEQKQEEKEQPEEQPEEKIKEKIEEKPEEKQEEIEKEEEQPEEKQEEIKIDEQPEVKAEEQPEVKTEEQPETKVEEKQGEKMEEQPEEKVEQPEEKVEEQLKTETEEIRIDEKPKGKEEQTESKPEEKQEEVKADELPEVKPKEKEEQPLFEETVKETTVPVSQSFRYIPKRGQKRPKFKKSKNRQKVVQEQTQEKEDKIPEPSTEVTTKTEELKPVVEEAKPIEKEEVKPSEEEEVKPIEKEEAKSIEKEEVKPTEEEEIKPIEKEEIKPTEEEEEKPIEKEEIKPTEEEEAKPTEEEEVKPIEKEEIKPSEEEEVKPIEKEEVKPTEEEEAKPIEKEEVKPTEEEVAKPTEEEEAKPTEEEEAKPNEKEEAKPIEKEEIKPTEEEEAKPIEKEEIKQIDLPEKETTEKQEEKHTKPVEIENIQKPDEEIKEEQKEEVAPQISEENTKVEEPKATVESEENNNKAEKPKKSKKHKKSKKQKGHEKQEESTEKPKEEKTEIKEDKPEIKEEKPEIKEEKPEAEKSTEVVDSLPEGIEKIESVKMTTETKAEPEQKEKKQTPILIERRKTFVDVYRYITEIKKINHRLRIPRNKQIIIKNEDNSKPRLVKVKNFEKPKMIVEEEETPEKAIENKEEERTPEKDIENKEEERTPDKAIENKEEEERTPDKAIENKEEEERTPDKAIENKEKEEETPNKAIENKEEEEEPKKESPVSEYNGNPEGQNHDSEKDEQRECMEAMVESILKESPKVENVVEANPMEIEIEQDRKPKKLKGRRRSKNNRKHQSLLLHHVEVEDPKPVVEPKNEPKLEEKIEVSIEPKIEENVESKVEAKPVESEEKPVESEEKPLESEEKSFKEQPIIAPTAPQIQSVEEYESSGDEDFLLETPEEERKQSGKKIEEKLDLKGEEKVEEQPEISPEEKQEQPEEKEEQPEVKPEEKQEEQPEEKEEEKKDEQPEIKTEEEPEEKKEEQPEIKPEEQPEEKQEEKQEEQPEEKEEEKKEDQPEIKPEEQPEEKPEEKEEGKEDQPEIKPEEQPEEKEEPMYIQTLLKCIKITSNENPVEKEIRNRIILKHHLNKWRNAKTKEESPRVMTKLMVITNPQGEKLYKVLLHHIFKNAFKKLKKAENKPEESEVFTLNTLTKGLKIRKVVLEIQNSVKKHFYIWRTKARLTALLNKKKKSETENQILSGLITQKKRMKLKPKRFSASQKAEEQKRLSEMVQRYPESVIRNMKTITKQCRDQIDNMDKGSSIFDKIYKNYKGKFFFIQMLKHNNPELLNDINNINYINSNKKISLEELSQAADKKRKVVAKKVKTVQLLIENENSNEVQLLLFMKKWKQRVKQAKEKQNYLLYKMVKSVSKGEKERAVKKILSVCQTEKKIKYLSEKLSEIYCRKTLDNLMKKIVIARVVKRMLLGEENYPLWRSLMKWSSTVRKNENQKRSIVSLKRKISNWSNSKTLIELKLYVLKVVLISFAFSRKHK